MKKNQHLKRELLKLLNKYNTVCDFLKYLAPAFPNL